MHPTGLKLGVTFHLIFYYILLYLTDMEQVSNIIQCIKHLSYHTLISNENSNKKIYNTSVKMRM